MSAGAWGCSGPGFGKVAVLTFDDAVKSHRTFVAPYLADLGFSATFFVTHRWMDDSENFMTWDEIAEIDGMGFEIGNHSWSHSSFASPKAAARLAGELALVENELSKVGVAKPATFAWCGNRFGPEAVEKLRDLGYVLARRGLTPELPDDHSPDAGAAYDPSRHDPLLIPTTGNSVPGLTVGHLRRMLAQSGDGVVILQFHGVPDAAHPWVHTPPELFRQCMEELKQQQFEVLALRDIAALTSGGEVRDPNVRLRNAGTSEAGLEQPVELVQTRADLDRWSETMVRHGYTAQEAAQVAAYSAEESTQYDARLAFAEAARGGGLELAPYPGGRHPRIGFLEGAIDPLRGTKASVFLPWDPEGYVVVDLPELITSDRGHLFLSHTHVPTIWNDRNVWIDNRDWTVRPDGGLESEWVLPNGVSFGASLRMEAEADSERQAFALPPPTVGSAEPPRAVAVAMELWLRNGLDETLTGLRTQLCVLLKGAPEFNQQTVANKVFRKPYAGVQSLDHTDRSVWVAWERAGRCWGNERCPCLHSDPVLPDCQPGETVRVRGRLWFTGQDLLSDGIARASSDFGPAAD